MASSPAALTPFQIAVAALFFSLPESEGFLLAGGAALAAQHLTTRPTQDLDLFTRVGHSTVAAARNAFENAATERGWSIRRIRDSETFCRLMVTGDDDLLVDLAILATMLGSLARFDNIDIPVPDHAAAELRRFFHQWQQQLLAESTGEDPQ